MTDYQFMDMLNAMKLFVGTCKKSACTNCEQQEQCEVAEKNGFALPCFWKQQQWEQQ